MGKNKTLIGIVCAVACEFLYGISYFFTKTATDEVSALTLLGWRFLFAFAVMSLLVVFGVLKVNYKGKNIKKLLRISILFPVLYFVAETVGINLTTASESGTLLACIPVASLVASSIILKEKPLKVQILGISVTLAGVLVTVLGVGIEASLSIPGYLALVLGVILYSLYAVYVEDATEFNGAEITYSMLAIGCLVYVIAALAEGISGGTMDQLIAAPFANPGLMKAIIYQGLGCSIGAFFMSNVAIAYIGVNRVSCFIGLSTVVSIVSGVLILHESFTTVQIIGAVVIICGVYIANLGQGSKEE